MSTGDSSPFDPWDAIVFDLDGTLIELAVDWATLEADLAETLREAGIDVDGRTSWELLEEARAIGERELAESVIAPAEQAGARASARLPLADAVEGVDGPVAVCSLNCEQAVRIGLAVHDIDAHVDAVVGRDTLAVWKPDPKPLEVALDQIGASPEEAVFVGDSPRDRTTADRAGTAFRWVEDVRTAFD